jgi:ABC-2 type transport system ATP-binding protein
MQDFIVETEKLTKRFGERVAVDGVDLRIPRGSAFGYLGPNGAGKTTLIRMLLGLTSATSGSMRLLGRPVPAERAAALARVGALVEEPRFHAFLTGRENLEIIAAARDAAALERIEGVLDRVGLAARADERVKKYSLGMRQRLGVARALLGDPELLILDEPTNGLDPAGMAEMRAFVAGLAQRGVTVLLSSHLMGEVEQVCDRVGVIRSGVLVAEGTVAQLRGQARLRVRAEPPEQALEVLRALPGAGEVTRVGDELEVATGAAEASEINRALVHAGIAVSELHARRASLEDVFLELTTGGAT